MESKTEPTNESPKTNTRRPPPPPVQRGESPAPRRIIQLQTAGAGVLFALCNDGTVWMLGPKMEWSPVPEIPMAE